MKKKKTVHLRRHRYRSGNKSDRYAIKKFAQNFNNIFLKRFQGKKKFYSFLLSFYSIGHDKILNYFKRLGFSKIYNLKIKKIKKIKNSDLYLKYNCSIKKKSYIKNKKKFGILKKIFLSKFIKIADPNEIRMSNVDNKKKLCLYFSYRHLLELPVHGQRTKTNAKTRKNFNIN